MLMALNDYKPVYIRGPIYSGKTTIVKMLSVRLGRLLVNNFYGHLFSLRTAIHLENIFKGP